MRLELLPPQEALQTISCSTTTYAFSKSSGPGHHRVLISSALDCFPAHAPRPYFLQAASIHDPELGSILQNFHKGGLSRRGS